MSSVDGSRSLQGASDEFHALICGACKTVDVERGASHYCQDCPIYLCENCKEHHTKLLLLKSHVILSGSQILGVTSARGHSIVVIHWNCKENQEVQHYCDDHKDVFCGICKHTKHYRCKVSHIQNKCSGYTRCNIDTLISKIKTLENNYKQLEKASSIKSTRLERSKEECLNEINVFRKTLNNFLDDREKSVLKLLDSKIDKKQKRISQHISTLTATLTKLEAETELLQTAKSNGGSQVMFATDVQVSRDLKDYEVTLSDIHNDAIDTDIKFDKNTKLENLLVEIDSLGCLTEVKARRPQKKILLYSKVQSQKQVNIKLYGDSIIPHITGTVFMPTGELVLCDWENSKLKMLDSNDELNDSLKLKNKSFDIAVVDAKTVIVTSPLVKQLQYIEVFPRLKCGRVLQLDKKCWGVHVTGEKIFISCHNNPGQAEIRILDPDGNLLQKLGVNQHDSSKQRNLVMFKSPSYITVSQSQDKIFVSDIDENTVTCMTMENRIIYKYKDDKLKGPLGMYCDEEDNIVVCGEDSNNVQAITANGTKQRDTLNLSSRYGLKGPYSLSFRESSDTLVVGCYESDHIFLFKFQIYDESCA